MKYILNKDYRLRGWTDHLSCLEHYPTKDVCDITTREYGLLSRCDGKTDIEKEVILSPVHSYKWGPHNKTGTVLFDIDDFDAENTEKRTFY